MVRVAFQARVGDAFHSLVGNEEIHQLAGVFHMALHAQGQGFDALQDLEGVHGAHAGAEVAQAFASGPQQEGGDGGFLGEVHAVEAVVGLGQGGEFTRGFPIEIARIHQHAADSGAVAAEELGGGVEDQVGAVLEGLQQVGAGEGGIHQQGQAVFVGQGGDTGNVQHVQARVAQGLAEEQAGVGADGGAPGIHVPGGNEGGLDAEAAQGVVQQVVAAAVEGTGGDDVAAGPHQGGHGQVHGGLAAGGGDGADAAFQGGDALLQHRHGGIGNAGIDVTGPFHVEEGGGLVGILEDEGGGQVDRGGAGAVLRVGHLAGVQGQGVEGVAVLTGHGRSPEGLVVLGLSGRHVRQQHVFQQPDAVLELQLALFQAPHQELVRRRVGGEVFDHQVQVPVFHFQLVQPAADDAGLVVAQGHGLFTFVK